LKKNFRNERNEGGTMKKAIFIAIVVIMTGTDSVIAGTILGTVIKESDGEPIPDLRVEAIDFDTGEYQGSANTNENGLYIIEGLPGGSYYVKVLTWNTDYVVEYYDNVIDSKDAIPVFVSEIGVAQNINFVLNLGSTITGVVNDSNGVPIPDLWVGASDYDTGKYRGGDSTNSIGHYVIPKLADGTYRVNVSTQGTDFVGEYYDNELDHDEATPVVVGKAEVVQNINFSLEDDGITVSGKVTDKVTGFPLADIQVSYWQYDFKRWNSCDTNNVGGYKPTGLLPGEVKISADPDPETYYAGIGIELELTEDVYWLDFALTAGANIYGIVIDASTAEPVAGVEVTYWNDSKFVYQSDFTHGDGRFTLENLPSGIATIEAKSDIYTGYAVWSPPLGGDMIYINEGEDELNLIIGLHKGALVKGSIKDHYGNPMSYFEFDYDGRLCDGASETDINGEYEIRLPIGEYTITSDEDDYGALPVEVMIKDVNIPVDVPDMIVYSEQTGGKISGLVNKPIGDPKIGHLDILAFETGTVFYSNNWYMIESINDTNDLNEVDRFTITKLPPGINYDVLLLVDYESPDDIDSVTVWDSARNIPPGESGIVLNYNSQGGTVTGKVLDTNNQPVLGVTVILTNLATGRFAGYADVDYMGNYTIYHVPAGTYKITAIRYKCLENSTEVHVVDGEQCTASLIELTCTGE
jgi:protocatechuate 3,4-dioxygenase beta subunit